MVLEAKGNGNMVAVVVKALGRGGGWGGIGMMLISQHIFHSKLTN